ncbi:thermonuclease family protein [Candidatus Parcubacteria bacterium]|nr:thermonuclease family protein [Patescibacteria group bacterium]MCG2693164.1 thermonuclease family protein [Candidatus Parcubacteria bacterium]
MKYTKKRNIIIGVIAVLVAFLGGSLSKTGKEVIKYFSADAPLYLVTKVIDGDTFEISSKERVRFINIDAPEKGECYFEESTKALKDLIEGKYVRLIKDVQGVGDFGRLLRYVILPNTQMDTDVKTDITDNKSGDDILVDKYLAQNGYARYMPSPPNNQYRDLISSAMWQAYDDQLGMWGVCGYVPENINKRQQDTGPENEDCIIKGNISEKGFGKTYLIPGCDNYNSVKVDTRKDEQYFCTEKEAQDAGFWKANGCP